MVEGGEIEQAPSAQSGKGRTARSVTRGLAIVLAVPLSGCASKGVSPQRAEPLRPPEAFLKHITT